MLHRDKNNKLVVFLLIDPEINIPEIQNSLRAKSHLVSHALPSMNLSRSSKRKAAFGSDLEYGDDSEQEEVGNSSSEGEASDKEASFLSGNYRNRGRSEGRNVQRHETPVNFIASSSSSSSSAFKGNDMVHSSEAQDKETGAWQKHTKGIGLKYLQKFGFKGRLGKEEDGICAPVEAVVHGTGAGLGFGKKREPKPEKIVHRAAEGDLYEGIGESEKIASSKSWKKKEKKNTIKDQPAPVVDMRFAATESNGGGSPPLGQELLYNLDLACDISRSSEELGLSQLKTKRAKLTHLNESISKVAEQVEHDREKHEHLTSVLSALQRIHNKMDKDSNVATVSSIMSVLRSLYAAFAEEFKLFGLISLLQLTTPVMRELGSLWDPSTDQPPLADIFCEWCELLTFFQVEGEQALAGQVKALMHSQVSSNFLGSARRFLGSADFKAPGACLVLMRSLETLLQRQAFEDILHLCVLPRLTAAINDWVPTSAQGGGTLASWVLPWRHLLGDKLAPLLSDVRRKLMKGVEIWQDDFAAIREHLEPWVDILGKKAFSTLLLRGVLPWAILYVRNLRVSSDCIHTLPIIFQLGRAMPEQHYRALIEGEFFPALVAGLAAGEEPLQPKEALLLLGVAKDAFSLEKSQCARYYYALALEVVHQRTSGGTKAADIVKAVRKDTPTYFRVLERSRL